MLAEPDQVGILTRWLALYTLNILTWIKNSLKTRQLTKN